MAGAALPNLAGAVENPLLSIGSALAQAPQQAADQEAALNQKGWTTLQPYIIAASRNTNLLQNNAFVGQMQRIAQAYRISGPLLDQAIQQIRSQLGGTAKIGMQPQGGAAVQTGPASAAPAQGAPAQQPAQSQPSSAAGASPQPSTKPVGSQPDLGTHWDDPKLKQASEIYNQDLEAAARTPKITSVAAYHAKLLKDGRAVGRSPQEIAADVKAYQVKAGVGPHPEVTGRQPQVSPQSAPGGPAQPAAGTAAPTSQTPGQSPT
jgi:hypothetical protein